MTPTQKRRMFMVLGIVAGVGIAVSLAVFSKRFAIGYTAPTEVVAGAVAPGKRFQLGGMVKGGSVQRTPGSLEIRFVVTDFASDVPVIYDRVLPDLFKENSGVVANGRLNEQGVFVADEVLAKHDENYMPPAVQEALRRGESRLENPPPQPAPQ
jgi:cytochrome c-type biogenesis protein CcmE